MKKQIAMIAMMASLVTTTAFAEGVKIDGSIKSAETKTILAPYSGVVDNYAVTAGDAVSMGDALTSSRMCSIARNAPRPAATVTTKTR